MFVCMEVWLSIFTIVFENTSKLIHANIQTYIHTFRNARYLLWFSTSIHFETSIPKNYFLMFWWYLVLLTVNIEGLGSGGSQKLPKFEMYVWMFGPKSMCFIEQIRLYKQSNSPPQGVEKSELWIVLDVCMFVCMDVWTLDIYRDSKHPKYKHT